MKNEDIELINRILSDDEAAFVSLVNKYKKQVHALAWRKIGDFHIAEEITQDTFLKVYQKLSTLKNPNQFSGWLYVIATNQCRAWLRKKHIETESLDDTETEWVDTAAYSRYVAEEQAKVNVEAQREVVKKLLTKLKESERTVITLHYFGEMTIEEISRFLGVSASAIKLRLHRARQRLQKEEPMIREALSNFKLSPILTDNIMQKVEHLKPAAPSSGSKPFIPWVIGASTAIFLALMLGLGSQYLAHFQQSYSLDSQSELAVKLIDAPILLNLDAKQDNRNLFGQNTDDTGKGDGVGQESNQVLSDEGDYTQWKLPENAKARLSKGSINDINFSPDATQIAVASATGVWIYDARTGAEIQLLTDHATKSGILAFSPDSKILATGTREKILLWDISSGKLLKSFNGSDGGLESLKFFEDGKTLLCVYHDGTACLWDVITSEIKKELRAASLRGPGGALRSFLGNSPFTAALYLDKNNSNGMWALGYDDGKIRLDNVTTGRHLRTLQVSDEPIMQLVFSPDGTLLVAEPLNGPLHLLDVTTGQSVNILTNPKIRRILSFSKDSKTLVCQARTGEIKFWDVATKTFHTTLGDKLDTSIHVFAFSPDFKILTGANQDGIIKTWDVNTGNEMASFSTGHTAVSGKLVFSPDSSILVSGHDKTILFWDTHNFIQTSKRIDSDTWISTFAFSSDGRTVISSRGFNFNKQVRKTSTKESVLGSLSIWDTRNWNKQSDFPVESHTMLPGQVHTYTSNTSMDGPLVFSQNGYMLAKVLNDPDSTDPTRKQVEDNDDKVLNEKQAKQDNLFSILVWEVPNGKLHFSLKGHTDNINALAFTSNGKMLASGSDDRTIRLWDTSTGTEMLNLSSEKTQALAFSANRKMLASGSKDGTIHLWDITTGKQLSPFKEQKGYCSILAFSIDNKMLANGTRNGTIYLWDIATGNKLFALKGHTDWIGTLSFSSDGKTLASRSSSGVIFLWDLTSLTNVN